MPAFSSQDSVARYVFIILTVLLLVPLFRPVVSPIDPVGYFAWARSALIDGDLNVANEFEHYGIAEGVPETPNGYLHSQWPAGPGLAWLPAMGLAHIAVLAVNLLGLGVPPNGYSWPYAWAAALTSVAAGFGAVLMTYRLNRRYVDSFAAIIATLVIWLATPLVFYQYHQPLMSHALDILLHTVFIATWLWMERGRGLPIRRVALGAVIGASVWIRPQNAVLLIATLMVMVYDAVKHDYLKPQIGTLVRRAVQLMEGCALLLLPLMIFWKAVYGSWIVNPYQANSGDRFNWRAPHIPDVLFSTDRGLFVWTPVVVFCIAGIGLLFHAAPKLTVLLTTIVLMNLYVIGSWSTWSGGDAFGPRFWIGQLPFFSLALGALIDHVDRATTLPRLWIAGLAIAFIGWNFLLMLQYSLGMIPPSGTVNLTRMFRQQVVVLPQLSERLIDRVQGILMQLR